MKPLDPSVLSPDVVLCAYAQGFFPMADSLDHGQIGWFNPPNRAILPPRQMKIPRSLKQLIRKNTFTVTVDTAFDRVIESCATATPDRPATWINDDIRHVFSKLHRAGFAHSIECWKDGHLAGGLYGLAIGSAFCGESMFSRESGASKIALVHLCARLHKGGFSLLDCQILNDHTARFGAYEIPKAQYLAALAQALERDADFGLGLERIDETALVVDFLNQNLTIS